MKTSHIHEIVNGIPIISAYQVEKSSKRYLLDSSNKYSKSITKSNKSKANPVLTTINKFGRKDDSFTHGIREHVRLGLKITDTVKGKLSLGAKILHVGGVGKVFTQLFSVNEGEKLLKALQCYLSTTSGPIAGLLFISTDKVAFCSDRSIKISSPKGEFIRIHYKVLIPLEKIKCVNQSQNVEKPSQKYIDIVTMDDFDFWFMGFLNHKKAFRYLHQSLPQA
ncbi:hypothetical protein Lal_00047336 [Lupinus albus]|uniref:Putative GRAM domain, PH domain-containing protein n=1 Tax=Lupinus albus TaxID=3870 RepID=A0A6A5N8Q8_LUPAL|nr:putative GRAM domain, PH domain-containing protein [Lupinus albus]KAF1878665.1 hypothetical protein Lal_00047336 [Lupinus albus]